MNSARAVERIDENEARGRRRRLSAGDGLFGYDRHVGQTPGQPLNDHGFRRNIGVRDWRLVRLAARAAALLVKAHDDAAGLDREGGESGATRGQGGAVYLFFTSHDRPFPPHAANRSCAS